MDAHVVITRPEAIAQGLDRYFTGKPCCHGHASERYVTSGQCIHCMRLASKGELIPRREKPPTAPSTLDGFTPEPGYWPDDGGKRRVPIYDHMHLAGEPPRLVRRVGWVSCLSPYSRHFPHRFFSPDVVKVRMCSGCKNRVDSV